MLALKIIGGIILFIIILLIIPAIAQIEYTSEDLTLKIKYLFLKFKILPQKEKKEKPKKKLKKQKHKKQEKKQPKKEEKQKLNKEKLKYYVKIGIDLLKSASKPFIKLINSIRIYDIRINMVVGCEDAFQTSMKYVKTQSIVHGTLATISNIFNVKVDNINIQPNFINQNDVNDIFFKVRIKPIQIIIIALAFVFSFMKKEIRRQKNQNS